VTKRLRNTLGALALAALSLSFSLVVIEAVARLLVRRQAARPFTTRGSIVRYHPTLGWDKPPGASAWLHRSEYSVKLEVNSRGLRGPDRPYAKPAGVVRTLLLGDSFTEGYAVAEERSVRAMLEQRLNAARCGRHEVVNGGTIGYSTDQEYLFYLAEGRRYAPDVVVALFCWNDLHFNTTGEQGKPYFELQHGELSLRNSPVPSPPEGTWLRSPEPRQPSLAAWRGSMALRLLSQRTETGNPDLHALLARLGLVEPARGKQPVPKDLWPIETGHEPEVALMWDVTTALFRAMKRAVEADSARLVLFYIPERAELSDREWELSLQKYQGARKTWRRGRIFERLAQLSRELGIPLVDPRPAMAKAQAGWRPAYYPEDGHWNEVGHALAAEELARFLIAERSASCAPGAP
jgi:lysophospholipase L1-like esterase